MRTLRALKADLRTPLVQVIILQGAVNISFLYILLSER